MLYRAENYVQPKHNTKSANTSKHQIKTDLLNHASHAIIACFYKSLSCLITSGSIILQLRAFLNWVIG